MSNESNTKAVVLFEDEHEFYTDQIIEIDGEYYFRHQNGGERSAWDERNFKPRCDAIDRREARRIALQWGEDPERVAEVLP